MKASADITEDELHRIRVDEEVEEKIYSSPLRDLLLCLVDLLDTDSQEYQTLEREKAAFSPLLAYPPGASKPRLEGSSSILPSTPPESQSRLPHADGGVSNKRKVSETSFDSRSTETTPLKLVHPEPKIQSLQNTFVHSIVNELWLGEIGIPWARGRRMFLTYTEYQLSSSSMTAGP